MADTGSPPTEQGRVSFTRLFLRSLLCGAGYIAAIITAALVGTFALYRGLEGDAAYQAFFTGTAILAMAGVAYATFLPICALVLLSEALRLRSVLVFTICWALIAVYHALGMVDASSPSEATLGDHRLIIAAASGIVGGFMYWLIAGRTAGDFRERRYLAPLGR